MRTKELFKLAMNDINILWTYTNKTSDSIHMTLILGFKCKCSAFEYYVYSVLSASHATVLINLSVSVIMSLFFWHVIFPE
jgi:hypothetical protein